MPALLDEVARLKTQHDLTVEYCQRVIDDKSTAGIIKGDITPIRTVQKLAAYHIAKVARLNDLLDDMGDV